MAAYPSFAQTMSSTESYEDNILLDRASNGALYGRAMWTGAKRKFQIEHDLTSADAATMRTFYATNRALPVSFTWAGDAGTYTCLFEAPPSYTPLGLGWHVRVQLVEA